MENERAVRVLVVDDHPAVRAGVRALVDAEPGMLAVDAVGDAFAVAPAVHALAPDVVVLDYQLPGADGLSLCRSITRAPVAPAVLMYTAFTSDDMLVPAWIAGASAIVDKAIEPRELTLSIRRVAAGEHLLDPPGADTVRAAAHRLPVADLPLLELLVAGRGPAEIAAALGHDADDVLSRTDAIFERLVIAERAL